MVSLTSLAESRVMIGCNHVGHIHIHTQLLRQHQTLSDYHLRMIPLMRRIERIIPWQYLLLYISLQLYRHRIFTVVIVSIAIKNNTIIFINHT